MNNIIRSFLAVVAALSFATSVQAQVKLDTTIGVRSKYVLSYLGLTVYDDPVMQGDFSLTLPHGLWAGARYSTDIHLGDNAAREVDYSVGWADEHVKVGVYYFDLNNLFSLGPVGDIVFPFVKAKIPMDLGQGHRLDGSLEMNYAFSTHSLEKSGPLPLLAVDHSWKIMRPIEWSHGVGVAYDGSVFGSDRGFIWRYSASLVSHVTDWMSIRAPYVRIHVPMTPSMDDRETVYIGGMDLIFHHTILEAAK